MGEGTRKLNLTLRIADRIITLSTVVSEYDKEGANMTARSFNRWVDHTRKLLDGNIDKSRIGEFDRLHKPAEGGNPEEISACSREHADFLRNIVREIDEG